MKSLPEARREYWYRTLRADGFDALSAWNGARARILMADAMREDEIKEFIAECAADGVECFPETAASILEERAMCPGAI